uniref:Uncharacterized protein n=1 Tax=Kalanchoe fedtschenkoi TaxID=63787 RepID=A0A7N0V0W1_KALFE
MVVKLIVVVPTFNDWCDVKFRVSVTSKLSMRFGEASSIGMGTKSVGGDERCF